MCSLHFIREHKLIVVFTNSVFMIFLIVYFRIRSGYALRGTPNKSPALCLALLLVVELGAPFVWLLTLVKLKKRPFGRFFNLMGRVTRLYIPNCVGPLSKSQRLEIRFARSRLLFCRTSSSHLTLSHKIKTRIFAGLNFMGRVTRFELATFGTTNRRSNQLSYTRHNFCSIYGCLFQNRHTSLKLRVTLLRGNSSA